MQNSEHSYSEHCFMVAFAFEVFQDCFRFGVRKAGTGCLNYLITFFCFCAFLLPKFKFSVVIRYIINYGSPVPFVVDLRLIRVRGEILFRLPV